MKCKICGKEVTITFIDCKSRDGSTWLGTSQPKGDSNLFEKSEFDFGWDYYAKVDLKKVHCKHCGYVEYFKAE